MRLVTYWRNAWKLHSVKIFAAIVMLPVAWEALPQALKDDIPPNWVKWIAAVLALIGVYARLIQQPSVKKDTDDDSTQP
ncbi:hypothetical protein MIF8_83 [Erwinia phage MIF8]